MVGVQPNPGGPIQANRPLGTSSGQGQPGGSLQGRGAWIYRVERVAEGGWDQRRELLRMSGVPGLGSGGAAL